MMFYKMIAGEWHKDGTRSHDMYDGSNVLTFLKSTTSGFYDLQLRARQEKWRRTYRWSEHAGGYVAD